VENNRARLLRVHGQDVSSEEMPAEQLERAGRVAMVRRALLQLSDRDRTLLLLREEGFAYMELAEAIGVDPSSVGTLLARARRRFAAVLGA
jgi:RNA polymerase sigma-70 factor (ECF subfamily)